MDPVEVALLELHRRHDREIHVESDAIQELDGDTDRQLHHIDLEVSLISSSPSFATGLRTFTLS